GDLIVCPDKKTRTIRIGQVSGPYEHRSEYPFYRNVRPVHWLAVDVPRDELSHSAHNEISSKRPCLRYRLAVKKLRNSLMNFLQTPLMRTTRGYLSTQSSQTRYLRIEAAAKNLSLRYSESVSNLGCHTCSSTFVPTKAMMGATGTLQTSILLRYSVPSTEASRSTREQRLRPRIGRSSIFPLLPPLDSTAFQSSIISIRGSFASRGNES